MKSFRLAREGVVADMPRLVDHEQRRRQITDAVRRVIAGRGLEAATFQSVAAEAGISVRLVQYYFGTKREFLLATHRAVVEDGGKRFAAALEQLAEGASPRAATRAILLSLLPMDERRRADTVVLGAFNQAMMSGRDIALGDLVGAPKFLVDLVAAQLERALRLDPDLPVDPEADAAVIVMAVGGLSQGLAGGYPNRDEAVVLLDRLLDRFFGPAD